MVYKRKRSSRLAPIAAEILFVFAFKNKKIAAQSGTKCC
jgi:hypothetical protein